jgi:UDP:flavonoid glycosyltransferase YjiC (YdhE family)
MMERGALEIQAYDELCFPGLAAEWGGQRPFVGALTMALPTSTDAEVASWIAAETPPTATSVTSTADLLADAVRRGGQRQPKNLRNHRIGYR